MRSIRLHIVKVLELNRYVAYAIGVYFVFFRKIFCVKCI